MVRPAVLSHEDAVVAEAPRSHEFTEGVLAFMAGKTSDSCPYDRGDVRTRFMSGFYHERVRQFLLRLETKCGLVPAKGGA